MFCFGIVPSAGLMVSELLYCFSAQMLQFKNTKSSQVDSHSHDVRAPETSRCQLILRFNFTSSLRFRSGSERKVCTFNDLPGVSTAEQQGTLAWDSFYILCCLRLFYSASVTRQQFGDSKSVPSSLHLLPHSQKNSRRIGAPHATR